MFEKVANELFKDKEHREKILQLDRRGFIGWAESIRNFLYPQQCTLCQATASDLAIHVEHSHVTLKGLLNKVVSPERADQISFKFHSWLPDLRKLLDKDAEAFFNGDPAAKGLNEVIFSYPGFRAITCHRMSHFLWIEDVPVFPRILSEYVHQKTGIDIHPGAHIGEYFFIDHGTGVVIGETTQIGNHVKIYQGVTLGALSVEKTEQGKKRHPTIEEGVVIYANATILGGETIIGKHSTIGGNIWLTKSVPENSIVYHEATTKIKEGAKK